MTNLSQTRGDTAGYTFKRIDAEDTVNGDINV